MYNQNLKFTQYAQLVHYGCSFVAKFILIIYSCIVCIFMHFQKYMHVIIICMSEMYAYIMHFYTCITHNICMSEIYSCLKYMRVRNICTAEIYAY